MKMSGSLYIHIPFCSKRCHYCHFYVLLDQPSLHQVLLDGLKSELELHREWLENHKLVSIYFGGGTPSKLAPELIAEILSWLGSLDPNIEITLEANPEDVDAERMREYRRAGINRVSLGVQTLDEKRLLSIGRSHSGAQALGAAQAAYEGGIENISVDLMIDLPGHKSGDVRRDVARLIELPITHLSLYNLTIEEPSLFFRRKAIIEKEMPSDEISLALLEEAVDALELAGLQRYEISAFTRGNLPSVHNMGYWTGRPYLGLGPSACSYMGGRRSRNVANLRRYAALLSEGRDPRDFEESLSPELARRELLAIGLRLIDGIDLQCFVERHGLLSSESEQAIEDLIVDGLLARSESRLKLTAHGLLFHDLVATRLI